MQDAGQVADPTNAAREPGKNLYRAIFNMKVVHLFALWALVYVGSEVTLGGTLIVALWLMAAG